MMKTKICWNIDWSKFRWVRSAQSIDILQKNINILVLRFKLNWAVDLIDGEAWTFFSLESIWRRLKISRAPITSSRVRWLVSFIRWHKLIGNNCSPFITNFMFLLERSSTDCIIRGNLPQSVDPYGRRNECRFVFEYATTTMYSG